MLFDNVQFIYELALAQFELKSFEIDFKLTNSLREFELIAIPNIEIFKEKSAYFKMIQNEYTDYYYITRRNRTISANQYLTHWIYPYKGKFHPQMIRALMNIIRLNKGDWVLDPFLGSGTTAVEAQLLGINCVGLDISPLCILQSKVKVESMDVLQEIVEWKDEIIRNLNTNLLNFEKNSFKNVINGISDEKVRNFYKIVKLTAISDNVRRKRNFLNSFQKNLNKMILSIQDYVDIKQELNLQLGTCKIKAGDARYLELEDNTIDGIITSPPYSIALDYIKNDAHALKEMGYNLEDMSKKCMGVKGTGQNKIEIYNEDMKKSLDEMYRVLKFDKFAVIILGDAMYQTKKIKSVKFVLEYAEKIGFNIVNNLHKIIFGLYNVMRDERILIFKK